MKRLWVGLTWVALSSCAPVLTLMVPRGNQQSLLPREAARFSAVTFGDREAATLLGQALNDRLSVEGYTFILMCLDGHPCAPVQAMVRVFVTSRPTARAPALPVAAHVEVLRGEFGALVATRDFEEPAAAPLPELEAQLERGTRAVAEQIAAALTPPITRLQLPLAADGVLAGPARDIAQGSMGRAIPQLEHLANQQGSSARAGALYDLGVIAEARGNADQARERYQAAVDLDPNQTLYTDALSRVIAGAAPPVQQ